MAYQQPVTIIMIEDDEGHARLIERNIRRAGVNNEIRHFVSGSASLEHLFAPASLNNGPFLVLLYLNLPFGVTLMKNLPLNTKLAAMQPKDRDAANFWDEFRAVWGFWNHVRWIGALGAAAAFSWALVEGGAPLPARE